MMAAVTTEAGASVELPAVRGSCRARVVRSAVDEIAVSIDVADHRVRTWQIVTVHGGRSGVGAAVDEIAALVDVAEHDRGGTRGKIVTVATHGSVVTEHWKLSFFLG